ncbi:hypothetical protein BGX38DRAFT_1271237 [Terfezia claveryi]|nr:hypothetical protein BGX38DRAFT_1271237 [Terfezia claveryi]
MIAGIIRSWLRPAQAQPVDDENSSLHVHVDAEGRAKDQIYWEREKERERKRTARANTRTQPAANGASIELTPRLPIFHGTGSPSTEGPVPSVNELVAPVLDRKAERFPAHGGGAVSAVHLQPNQVVPAPPVIVPPSQPRSGRIGTTSATFNMAESHDHYVPLGGFSEPSAEECMALAAAEAARQREEEDALSAPAPPSPSQSPALSDIDYRRMNLSPGPVPSFLEPYYPRQNPPVATEVLDQSSVHLQLQQPVTLASQSKDVPSKRISPLVPATAPAPPIASGGGVVFGVEEDARLRQHKSQNIVPETEAVITAGESKHRDKGKDRERQSHHPREISPSSTRDKDKTRSKDRHKHKDAGDKKEKRGKRERKERKERKENIEKKKEKGHSVHKEKGHNKHKDKQKEPIVQNPSGAVPIPEIGRIPPPKLQKEKENVPPPAKLVAAPSSGILKPADEGRHYTQHSEGHASAPDGKHRTKREATAADPGKRKSVKVRTPEEQAAHLKRKEARRKAKEQERAIRQTTEGNKGVEGATSTEHNHREGHHEKHRKGHHKEHHKSKSAGHEDREKKRSKDRKRDGESVEERSQRKAARRARKLAEALKADPGNASSGPPLSEGNKRHSIQLELSGRILSPVPEGSTEPAESIRLPLSPAGYPIQPTTPIPNLPELPAGDVVRNQSRPPREPVAYTAAQIPPRPSTPPPAAYSSQDITLPLAGAARIPQPRRKRSYDDKVVVPPAPNHAESSRHRPSKITPVVPYLVAASATTSESKAERQKRRAERSQLASQPYPPPQAAIVPPEVAHAARQHRKKRSPEEIEAKRLRKEARKAKVAAANAALQAINEDEILPSVSVSHPSKGSRPELSLYQASVLRNNSVVGLHQPDPPGYGHYGYGTDGKTVDLTSPPPGKGPRHRKSVTIDIGARDGGSSYARDGREKARERERDRDRDRERARQRKEKEKEAKAKQAQDAKEAKEAKLKAQNTSGKRFGMFSLKRSFSKLFRA